MKRNYATIPTNSLQERLLRWRIKHDFTQREAAEALSKKLNVHLSVRTLQSWEIGRHKPSAIVLATLYPILNLNNNEEQHDGR